MSAFKPRSVLFFLFAGLLGVTAAITPVAAHAETKSLVRKRLDTEIVVQLNGDLKITETNVIEFTSGTFSWGFRDIELSRLTDVRDIVVTENGIPLETEIGYTKDNKLRIQYYFLTPARNEQRTFVLNYTVIGATRYYDDGDQVYWAAVYAGRDGLAVQNARAVVRLPAGATATKAEVYGVRADVRGLGKSVVVAEALEPIPSGRQMEVRVQFPHGIIYGKPAAGQQTYNPAHAETKSLVWKRLDTEIVVQINGDLKITETNVIEFTSGAFSWGFRDIELSRLTDVRDIVVTENGIPLKTEIGYTKDNKLRIQYYFLTPARNEQRTFVLNYTVIGATRYYDDGDQVYWAAVYANRDGLAVQNARAVVRLPAGATATKAKVYGVRADVRGLGKSVVVAEALEPIPSGRQMEVRVQFPHGIIYGKPAAGQQTYNPAHAETKSLVWKRLDTEIVVQLNGDLKITETNVIEFTSGTFSWGFRDIELSRLTDVRDIVVTENGIPLETKIGYTKDNKLRIQYYFLTPARNEQRTFVLNYTVIGATRYYDDGDQVYWAAVYADRDGFAVQNARAVVRLPAGATATKANVYGVRANVRGLGKRVVVAEALEPIPSGKQMEVRVQFPHGIIYGKPAAGWSTQMLLAVVLLWPAGAGRRLVSHARPQSQCWRCGRVSDRAAKSPTRRARHTECMR